MTSRKAILRAVGFGLCLPAIAGAGCGHFMTAIIPKRPSTRGTWTGRLVVVKARDIDGREYRVAALDPETGPRLTGGTYQREGRDEEPLAVLTLGGVVAIEFDDLRVPPG